MEKEIKELRKALKLMYILSIDSLLVEEEEKLWCREYMNNIEKD